MATYFSVATAKVLSFERMLRIKIHSITTLSQVQTSAQNKFALFLLEPMLGIAYNGAQFIQYSIAIMTDTNKPELPNQLSINPRSKFYVEEVFEHEIGVTLNGKERFDVEEYNISEGWIKIASPKALDRRGQPLLLKVKGTVEVFYK